MRSILLPCVLIFYAASVHSQNFTSVREISPGLRQGRISWGDLNNDGRLDFVQTGNTIRAEASTLMVLNTGSGFVEMQRSGIPNIFEGRSDWGDYDNDGDLDLLIAGDTIPGVMTRVYKNSNGQLTLDKSIQLKAIDRGSLEWGDFDVDGDLDILLSGQDGSSNSVTIIYKNDNGVFHELSEALITGVSFGQASWIDYDNDGDLDVIVGGVTGIAPTTGPPVLQLYENINSSSFSQVFPSNFEGLSYPSISIGDYDNDGDMDILVSGLLITSVTAITAIYENNNGAGFNKIVDSSIPQVVDGSVKWGDADNDGDLDILIAGQVISSNQKIAALYSNTGSGYQMEYSFHPASLGDAEFGDYDGDGDLDVIISGQDDSDVHTFIYRNENTNQSLATNGNTPPAPPANLISTVVNEKVTLSWGLATDNRTPQAALTYNIYVRSATDTLVNAFALSGGRREIVRRGNRGTRNMCSLNLGPGDYLWSVQAIDNGFSGSTFSPEASLQLIVGITHSNSEANIFAYPNPVRDQLTICLDTATGFFQSKMYDLYGSEIWVSENSSSTQLVNLRWLEAGLYILQVRTANGLMTTKILKE